MCVSVRNHVNLYTAFSSIYLPNSLSLSLSLPLSLSLSLYLSIYIYIYIYIKSKRTVYTALSHERKVSERKNVKHLLDVLYTKYSLKCVMFS